eukprot:GHVR01184490.1.p1 GENE.GHVR01184490.1~~GHVR01184490.1.p1  ORF type:complete len:258 (+),score=67.41 GHVR01184490.1:236-1009(+)
MISTRMISTPTEISLTVIGHVTDGLYLIKLLCTEGTINFKFILEFNNVLDEIESSTHATALIITNEGKFFSNGLDLDELSIDPQGLLKSFNHLLARILIFPLPTVAAVNGHAFAGGAMLALSCDYRVMNKAHGYICINEVDIGFILPVEMIVLLKSKIDRSRYVQVLLYSKRIDAYTLLQWGLVDYIETQDTIIDKSITIVNKYKRNKSTIKSYSKLKQLLYSDVVYAMRGSHSSDCNNNNNNISNNNNNNQIIAKL